MKVSDFFAKLYVAGRFADAGWNVYFPRRDRGEDEVFELISDETVVVDSENEVVELIGDAAVVVAPPRCLKKSLPNCAKPFKHFPSLNKTSF